MVKKITLIILSVLMIAIAATAVTLGLVFRNDTADSSQGTEQGGDSSSTGDTLGDGSNGGNTNGDGSNGGNTNGDGSNSGGNSGSNGGATGGSGSGGNGGSTQPPQTHICSFKLKTTVAADCLNGGYSLYSCSCGKEEQRDKTKALGHDYKQTIHKATCQTDWSMTEECTRCNDTKTQTVEDSKVPCEYTWTDTVVATCTTDGSQSGTCKWCGGNQTRKVDALGHNHGAFVSNNDATCAADGTETAECLRCGNKSTRIIVGSKLPHSYGEYINNNNATCALEATETRTCAGCGDKDTRRISGTKLPHSYGNWITTAEATCKTEGERTKTCKNCGDKVSQTTGYGNHKLNGNSCTVCGGVFDANTFFLNVNNSSGQTAAFGTVTLEFTYLDSNGNDMSCEIYIVQTYTLNGRQIVNRTKVRSATQLSTDWYKECCFGDFTLYSLEEGCNVNFRNCWMDYDVHLSDNWLTFIVGGSGRSENGSSYTFEQRYNVDL